MEHFLAALEQKRSALLHEIPPCATFAQVRLLELAAAGGSFTVDSVRAEVRLLIAGTQGFQREVREGRRALR